MEGGDERTRVGIKRDGRKKTVRYWEGGENIKREYGDGSEGQSCHRGGEEKNKDLRKRDRAMRNGQEKWNGGGQFVPVFALRKSISQPLKRERGA